MSDRFSFFAKMLLQMAEQEEARKRRVEEQERHRRLAEEQRKREERLENQRLLDEAKKKLEERERERKEEQKKEKERREQEKRMSEMQNQGLVQFLIEKVKFDAKVKDVREYFFPLKLGALSNPDAQKKLVEFLRKNGFQVNSIEDMENFIIEFWKDAANQKIREKLKGNPYEWLYTLPTP